MSKDTAMVDSTEDIMQIDAAGDSTVTVKNSVSSRIFLVCSAALRLANPAWTPLLDPPGQSLDAATQNKGVILFTNDDPDAFLIILRIAHLQFNELPRLVTFETLLELTITCHKYDTFRLVRPFFPKWLECLAPDCHRAGWEEWLFIAWTFGDVTTFQAIASRLVLSIGFDDTGAAKVYEGDDEYFLGVRLPPGSLDVILEARSERLEATLTACYDLLERYESSSYSDGYLCCGQDENCDALNFGSMIKELKRCGLWPRPAKSSGITGSVRDIIERLTLAPSPVLPSSQEFSHEGCTFGKALEEDLNFIRERKEPSGVVDSQRIHMAAQCKAVW